MQRQTGEFCQQCRPEHQRVCAKRLSLLIGDLLGVMLDHFVYKEKLMRLLPDTVVCRDHIDSHQFAHAEISRLLSNLTAQMDRENPRQSAIHLGNILIEELETSNEELQATNEELMASNEELQSSNEELQSVNEEMSTVNAEFQEKMLVLNRVNADLDSMAKSAGVATVFVDAKGIITRFSPDAMQIFNLRESDVGRPLEDITHVLRYENLRVDMATTLQTERMIEREVQSLEGRRSYLVRMLPYSVPSSTDRGVVATFVDMTSFHDARRLQTIIDALPEHVAVVDQNGTIVLINAAWRRFAKANGDSDLSRSGLGINYMDVCKAGNHEDGSIAATASKGLRSVLERTIPSFSMEYPCHSPTEKRWFVMNVAPVSGEEFGAVVSHVNISAWYNKEV